ncbi:MAG TPA: DUF5682 family protein [Myxococcota bacterium]|nr:DUF5682 family protein [Myxococcota bacterium]HRY92254.1 DUF5682 family protein [Myxococcota bacterium]HSA21338.1 DUF5682 family protein [Myxococcota bacterium]
MGGLLRSARADRRRVARGAPAELLAAGRFHVLPIAHASPWCAARVERAFAALAPGQVCLELPVDAQPLLPYLRAARKLPLAIFGFEPGAAPAGAGAEPGAGPARATRGYLPLGDFSPELAALRAEIPVAFVDLPFEHLLAEPAPRAFPGLELACRRLRCRDAAELAERLLGDERAAGWLLELAGWGGTGPSPRERFMAARIRALAGQGPILVVAGAAHARALADLLREGGAGPAPDVPPSAWELFLVPYDEARLHRTGAAPFPRWRRLCRDRAGEALVPGLAVAIGRAARRAGLLASVSDTLELVQVARSLAHLRAERGPGLRDLLDAVRLTLVRDAAGEGGEEDLSAAGAFGPLGPIVERICVGARRGALPVGTPEVPIVADVRRRLAAARLPLDRPARPELDVVRSRLDRERSRLLHALAYVGSPGVRFWKGPDLAAERDVHLLFEHWALGWDEAAESQLLELAPRGETLSEVVRSLLRERLGHPLAGVEEVSRELVAALVMGLGHELGPHLGTLARLAAREPDLVPLWRAASRLGQARVLAQEPAAPLALGRVEDLLLARALEVLATTTRDPGEGELLDWLDCVHGLRVHVATTGERRDELLGAARSLAERGPSPLLLGAASLLLLRLGALSEAELLERFEMQCRIGARDPEALCRFLLGLLLPGRSLPIQVPALLDALGEVLEALPDEVFAGALPELRFAFSALSPRELRRLSAALVPPAAAGEPTLPAGHAAALARELGRLGLLAPGPEPALPGEEAHPRPAIGPLRAERFRLVLGGYATALPPPADERGRQRERLLDFLYRREFQGRRGGERAPGEAADPGGAGSEGPPAEGADPGAALAWLRDIRAAFPGAAADTLERHAIERYRLYEMLRDPRMLGQMTPSMELVRGLLAVHRDVPPEVLVEIRRIIRAYTGGLRRALERELAPAFAAALRAPGRSPLRLARNLDLGRTLRRNLKRTDPETGQLVLTEFVFRDRVRRRNPWRLVLLVDQSGSMADALVQTAVLAGLFGSLPSLSTRLVVFDEQPLDLSDRLDDPVEVLLATGRGGGTCIARALAYAARLLSEPARSLVVLVTDLAEGGPVEELLLEIGRLKEAGARLLVLSALDPRGRAAVDPVVRRQVLELGVPVGARSPAELAAWVAEQLR